jgi:hypothetical protein
MDAETKATATSAKEKRCHPMKKAAPLARGAHQIQSSNRRHCENTTPGSGGKSVSTAGNERLGDERAKFRNGFAGEKAA